MIPVIPLAVAGALAVFAFAMAKKDDGAPKLLPGIPPEPTPGAPSDKAKTPAGADPAVPGKSAPAGDLPPGTTAKTGDTQIVHADDAFDQAVATAIAAKNVPALKLLAEQAEKMGLLTVAKSIRDELARLTETPPIPTTGYLIVPDKAKLSTFPTTTLATYIVQAGDTGEKVAAKFTGDKSRWKELLTVNPRLASSQYGISLYTGHRINLPASWPSGVPVLPPAPLPSLSVPAVASPGLNTYTVVAGDTGERVAQKFVGDKSRWPELLTVNPTLKSAQYGIALYTGHKINLPASWPSSATQIPREQLPIVSPIVAPPIPAAPPALPAPPAPMLPGRGSSGPPEGYTFPTGVVLPAESDARAASRQLTDYLTGLGGLAGRYKENSATVKGYQTRLGTTVDGKYGRGDATAIIQNGIIPVAPYYWPKVNTASIKAAFITMVKNYAAADPQRKTQWDKLLVDTQRS